MNLDFYLRFYTHPGQSIFVTGNLPELGDGNISAAIPLTYINGEFWHCNLVLSGPPAAPVHYHYILKGEDGNLTEEWGDDKFIEAPPEGIVELQVIDTWNYSGEYENVFFTQPFRTVLLPGHKTKRHKIKRSEERRVGKECW